MKYLYVAAILLISLVGLTLQYSNADTNFSEERSIALAGIIHNLDIEGLERDLSTLDNSISDNIAPIFAFTQKESELVDPDIQSQVALIQDLETNQILFQRNAFESYQLASITKLLTVITVLQEYEWGTETFIEMNDFANATYGRTVFPVGESFSVEDYIKAMLLPSNNPASTRLAEFFGNGDTQIFVEKMNQQALRLGMYQSQFVNPHGLDEEGQYSSASDIIKLLNHTYQEYPFLWEVMQQIELEVLSQSGLSVKLGNSNELIGQLPNMFGGKTGFTNQALETLASIVMIQERPVGIVVMQAPIGGFRFKDTETLAKWIESQYELNL